MSRIKDQTKTTSLQLTDKFPLDRSDPDETFSIEFGDMKNQIMSIEENDIGLAGDIGFGVGICPASLLPAYLLGMVGYTSRGNDNYGNYVSSIDGSVMCWIPAFVYKITNNTSAPFVGTKIEIKTFKNYGYMEDAAIADGYALHRAFIDGGAIKKGFFVDKYKWSMTNFVYNSTGIASSIKNGNPVTSSSEANNNGSNNYAGSFSNFKSNGQAPADIYGGAWAAAKSRGNDFAVWSMFIHSAIAMLSLAHGQAATAATNCAWYDATGVKNFPKGNNNYGADYNDSSVTFPVCTDSYWAGRNEARKNGSGSTFAKTTHNGQNCGVSDLQGDQWQIVQGLTCIAASKTITAISRAAQAVFTVASHGYSTNDILFIEGSAATEWTNMFQYNFYDVEVVDTNTFKLKKRRNDGTNGNYVDTSALTADYTSGFSSTKGTFYILKESVAVKNVTGGSGGANDHFANTTLFDTIDLSDVLVNNYSSDRFGSGTNQVLASDTSRSANNYRLTALGLPKDRNAFSSSGTNNFGTDYWLKWIRNELCVLVGGNWFDTDDAGAWAVNLTYYRAISNRYVSARACLYV
jgi:hypothetical protein